MKVFDIVLIAVALVLLLVLLPEGGFIGIFGLLLKLVSFFLLLFFAFYWKFSQYKGSMSDSWAKVIETGEKVFVPVLNWLDGIFGKISLGPKLVTSKSPLIIVIVLSLLIFIF